MYRLPNLRRFLSAHDQTSAMAFIVITLTDGTGLQKRDSCLFGKLISRFVICLDRVARNLNYMLSNTIELNSESCFAAVFLATTLQCLKKVPTFKLSVTLSNLNRFSNFCTARKRIKFATKGTQQYPPHLRSVVTLPSEIQKSHFLQISSRYGKMQTNCILSLLTLLFIH